MDDKKRTEIEQLAREAFKRNELYKALSMMNTAGLDAKEREQQSVDYAIALAGKLEADANLDKAITLTQGVA